MEKYNLKSPKKYTPKKQRSKTPSRTKKDIVCAPLRAAVSSSEPFEEYQPSAGLFTDEDVEGKDVFQVTPLKLKSLSLKDNDEKSSRTPESAKKKAVKSITTSKENQGYSLRQRMKQELANLQTSTLESDPEDSDEYNTQEDDDSEDENHTTPKKKKSVNTFPETYFFAQKQKKTVTSNRTLSNLKIEHTDIEELQKILRSCSEYHRKEKESLYKRYKSQFQNWMFLLQEGFNILLYGVGSKQKLLNEFCKDCLEDCIYVSIHGYFPSLNTKQILSSIIDDALEYEGKFPNMFEQMKYIKNRFSKGSERLYLIIHSIDGVSLRNVKAQTLLSSLAAAPNIHLVCSVDHINSPLIWDQIMLSQFRWVWCDTTTFEPYTVETSYEQSLLHDQSNQLLLSSLLHVFRSLTPNAQGVFLLLARRQAEEKEKNFTGISFHEWYHESRESFLVNSEITMQAQLSEFKNHKLLASKKSIDGIEMWRIPVDDASLERFLENCK